MTESDAPLTQSQMRLMAYIDDEMSAQERTDFERQLAEDADLASEVAEMQCLETLTRSMELAEPTDHEVRRFWASFYNRGEWQLGWALMCVGAVMVIGYGLFVLQLSAYLLRLLTGGPLIGGNGGGG